MTSYSYGHTTTPCTTTRPSSRIPGDVHTTRATASLLYPAQASYVLHRAAGAATLTPHVDIHGSHGGVRPVPRGDRQCSWRLQPRSSASKNIQSVTRRARNCAARRTRGLRQYERPPSSCDLLPRCPRDSAMLYAPEPDTQRFACRYASHVSTGIWRIHRISPQCHSRSPLPGGGRRSCMHGSRTRLHVQKSCQCRSTKNTSISGLHTAVCCLERESVGLSRAPCTVQQDDGDVIARAEVRTVRFQTSTCPYISSRPRPLRPQTHRTYENAGDDTVPGTGCRGIAPCHRSRRATSICVKVRICSLGLRRRRRARYCRGTLRLSPHCDSSGRQSHPYTRWVFLIASSLFQAIPFGRRRRAYPDCQCHGSADGLRRCVSSARGL